MTPDDIALVDFLSERTHEWSDIWYLFNFFVAGLVTASLVHGLTRMRALWMTIALQTFAWAHNHTIADYYRPFCHAASAVKTEEAKLLIETIAPPPLWQVQVLYWFAVAIAQVFIYRRLLRENKELDTWLRRDVGKGAAAQS